MDYNLFQNFIITYISCGIYTKLKKNRENLNKLIKEDIESLKSGTTFQNIVEKRKNEFNILPKPKKMPCGALETDSNHFPILKCDYCDHKYTEASIEGFC